MDPSENDELNGYGTLFQVLGLIAGVGFTALAITYFIRADDAPQLISGSLKAAGWTYLIIAILSVIVGQFLKTVTKWMASMYSTLIDLRRQMGILDADDAEASEGTGRTPDAP